MLFWRVPIAIPVWIAVVVMAFAAAPVFAHPLGNTSVNLYERIEVGVDEITVRFVLDVSEFPALRETEFADTNDDGIVDADEATTYLDGFWVYLEPRLVLTANGLPLPLSRVDQSLTFPPGQNGLALMRAVYDLATPQPTAPADGSVQAVLTETAFEGVPGWHEIVVRAGAGVSLVESSVPEDDVTLELTVYPPEMLNSPLSVREATFTYVTAQPSGSAGATPASTPPATVAPVPTAPNSGPRPVDPLVSLLGEQLTLAAMLVGLFLAMVLGAVHALTPGHGKTLVAAYLVGTRANVLQGLWLGVTVALTHTAGILILGVATLAFTEWVVPERVVGWLSVATGLLITGLGAIFIWRSHRLRAQFLPAPAAKHVGGLGHGHPEDSGHRHQHDSTPDLRRRDVAVLGIVGGLVPSGSALILLLSAIALNEVPYGLLLIVAFGLGMAIVLASITTGIVLLRRTSLMGWERWRDPRLRWLATWLPVISGLIVIGLGMILTFQAIRALP
jgi:nickel/cobalt exporter